MSPEQARAQLLADARRQGCTCAPAIIVPVFLDGRMIVLPDIGHQDWCRWYPEDRRAWRRQYRRRRLLPEGEP